MNLDLAQNYIDRIFNRLLIGFLAAIPLAVWKLIDIIIWLLNHLTKH